MCYCPSLRKYMVSTNVTFLKNTSFSQDSIHTSQGRMMIIIIGNDMASISSLKSLLHGQLMSVQNTHYIHGSMFFISFVHK